MDFRFQNIFTIKILYTVEENEVLFQLINNTNLMAKSMFSYDRLYTSF